MRGFEQSGKCFFAKMEFESRARGRRNSRIPRYAASAGIKKSALKWNRISNMIAGVLHQLSGAIAAVPPN